MNTATPVDRLFQESTQVLQAIGTAEPSLSVAASDNFRKSLVLASASYFEHRVSTCVDHFVHERTAGAMLVVAFVRNKAISRQYHTWFKWDDNNANQFFGLFGPEFKQMMQEKVRASEQLRTAIRSFLEIGNERNKMIHQDFASFPLEKTLEEIYLIYCQALYFVDGLPNHFRECAGAPVIV